ncbi:hypothetical protein [Neobacillus niacini]|uniref:hypothetical protein n=1 Tax=Neobacillus niacini TaxID=86668 RepID=UPI002864D01E|nr:hypothetical protein [Neobacillus niacini]MDR7000170.1 hypothetical protein [Neobacillus niacini]
MRKLMISVLSIFTLNFLLFNVIVEAKTRTGTINRPSSTISKSIRSTSKSSTSQSNSSSQSNYTTKTPSYSSFKKKYPKSSRYFSGSELSKTLLFGTTLLMLNDSNNEEPTYEDEEGNIYTLADMEEMDIHIPEEEPVEEDLYSETVEFDETATDMPNEIGTATSNDDENIDTEENEEEDNSFNWIWLILPFMVAGIAFTLRQKTKNNK